MPKGIYKHSPMSKRAKENMSAAKKKWWGDSNNSKVIEEIRKKKSEHMKAWWKDPQNKEAIDKIKDKTYKGIKEYWKNPENRKKASIAARKRYYKRDKKLSDYTRLHPDLIKEIKYQYEGGSNYRDIVGLLGINQITARKYIKMIKENDIK